MKTMYHIKSISRIKFIFIVLTLEGIQCSIDGKIYKPKSNDTKTGDDPCNPLYWYPRHIPEYCNFKNMPPGPSEAIPNPDLPIPIPIPVPIPPLPMPIFPSPLVPPLMMPPHVVPPGHPPPPLMIPHPIMPLPIPLPFGIPLAPTNPMVPVAGIPLAAPPPPAYRMPYLPPYLPQFPLPYPQPYPSPFPAPYPAPPPPYHSPYPMPPPRGIGMVPGLPGLVSPDGGINIMPFSDAYSDMLEKHKQKTIRKRLQKLLNEYDRPPWKSSRKTRRHNDNDNDFHINEDKLEQNTIET